MSDKIGIVILAAGKGTRLKMAVPKPLAPIGDETLIDYVIRACCDFGDLTLITGHQATDVKAYVTNNWPQISLNFVHQEHQLGTGHAVQTYFDNFSNANNYKYTIIACADTPLLNREIFDMLISEIQKGHKAVCATFNEIHPYGYGRIIKGETGFKIVEEKDASEEEKKITEVNSGLYIFETKYLEEHIKTLDNSNKSGEFYLTDTCKIGADVVALNFSNKEAFIGVNDLEQLSQVDILIRKNISKKLMKTHGVRIIHPENTYVYTVKIGSGTVLHPNCFVDSKSTIGENVIIESGVHITKSTILDGAHIKSNTVITESKVAQNAKIGPMAHLRPGCEIGQNVKLGNFVEVKKSVLDEGVSVSHLSYVGDATIGKNVNIGCGFITCNYDGAQKHRTVIGEGTFVGSDCQMIAPIEIGKNAYIGSGSTINQDVPDDAFAIARERQVTKLGMAKRFIKRKAPK
jgi:bifunctional UDP-N-acetylglucosamine pyrophosphorylase / glucosamine-1-phosphate N-acetyltransferase